MSNSIKKTPVKKPLLKKTTAPKVSAAKSKTASSKVISTPLPVEFPTESIKSVKTLLEGEKKPRGANKITDPWEELPEKTRAYLKLEPYGSNLIVDKKALNGLQDLFITIRELPLPNTVWRELNKHQNKIREILELISVEDWQENQRAQMKEYWEPFFPTYDCKCHTKKRRPPKTKK